MERAVILCDSDSLSPRDFAELASASSSEITASEDEPCFDLAELEERAIRRALVKADNNQTEAARYLGIGHDALRYRLKKYGISSD